MNTPLTRISQVHSGKPKESVYTPNVRHSHRSALAHTLYVADLRAVAEEVIKSKSKGKK